jgi:hypothetical protein
VLPSRLILFADQFLYDDCWQNAVLSQHKWLRPCLEEACSIMVARVTATSRCREKQKEPILAWESGEIPLLYVPLYPPLPLAPSSAPSPLTLDGEVRGTVTPVKSGLETSGASTPLTSLSPMDPIPILSLPVFTSHSPLSQGHLASPHGDLSSPQAPTTLQMPLREVEGPVYYD